MGTKRFRSLRLWHNTLVMIWAVPFALLPGVIFGASTGRFELLYTMGGLCAVGLVVALRRDRLQNCHLVLEGEELTLVKNKERRVVAMDQIIDASLIDRGSARGYITEHGLSGATKSSSTCTDGEPFMRYCTVDIGLTSLTFGFGRSLIDRLPQSKRDLVLLRLQGGEDLLLSPAHVQDLVDSLSRRKLRA